MGAICLVFGGHVDERQAKIAGMVAAMPHRGAVVESFHHADLSLSLLSVDDELTICDRDELLVAVDGYLVPVESGNQGLSSAELLHKGWFEHGLSFLDVCDGEYAAFVWDRVRRKACVVVGPSGTRPLFWSADRRDSDTTLVAPEMLPLLKGGGISPSLNQRAIAQHLLLGGTALNPEITPYREVSRIPGGSCFHCDPSGDLKRTIEVYWDPSKIATTSLRGGRLADELRSAIRASVLDCVPGHGRTTLSLSGGLDSSTIYAFLREAAELGNVRAGGVRALSYLYPGTISDERSYIEANHEKWQTIGCFQDIKGLRIADFNEDLLSGLEFPTHGGTAYQLVVTAHNLKLAGMKGLITGLSGDFWFLIPPLFQADALRKGRLLRAFLPAFFPLGVVRGFTPSLRRRLIDNVLLPAGSSLRAWLRPSHPPVWLGAAFRDLEQEKYELIRRLSEEHGFAKGRMLYNRLAWQLNCSSYLNFQQMLARYGIQLFDPLGSKRIVESVLSVAADEMGGRSEKHFLRQVMQGLLPDRVNRKYAPTFHQAALEGHDPFGQLDVRDDWMLCDAGVVERGFLEKAISDPGGHKNVCLLDAIVACELYLRRHFCGT